MSYLYIIIMAGSAALMAWGGTYGMKLLMERLAVVDEPDERRNHAASVPRGGGVAVVISAICFLIVASASSALLWALFLLAVLCFVDDIKGIKPAYRLLGQALLIALLMFNWDGLAFQGLLPLWADHLASGFLLLWFVNLYNFMDGIDEITTAETVGITIGISALYLLGEGVALGIVADSWIMCGALAGFWYWNRHPARIFLGDVGSVPVGLIMGFLMLQLAAEGYWEAALILPAYYLFDATVTLLRRLLKGEKIWHAHSTHAYQQAVRSGFTHRQVAGTILGFDALLAVLAGATALGTGLNLVMIAAAYLLSGMLYLYFLSGKKQHPPLVHAHPAS